MNAPLRVCIGGPVGSGKTALMDALCKYMRDHWHIAAITNDIYTREDAEFLTRSGALVPDRIIGVETGGCPHTAIREDASINLAAVAEMNRRFPGLDLILIESGQFTRAQLHGEIQDLVAGTRPGRERDDERILIHTTGLVSQDIALAHFLYRKALDEGVGIWLPAAI